MAITIRLPYAVRSDADGFNWLAEVAQRLNGASWDDIRLVSTRMRWFDSNLCAPLGALLQRAGDGGNTLQLDVPGPILGAWSRNGFAEKFGGGNMIDTFDTTLAYYRFNHNDAKTFARYVQQELMPKDIPQMTPEARRQFERNLQELFDNAILHGLSAEGVFSCGQFYPHKNYINFTVSDLGAGFAANVQRKTGRQWTAIDAIEWASQEGHTTRTGNISGGLGLGLLCEFVTRNGGCLQVVSQDGFWEFNPQGVQKTVLDGRFPGTFVNLQIKTDDQTLYQEFGTAGDSEGEVIAIF